MLPCFHQLLGHQCRHISQGNFRTYMLFCLGSVTLAIGALLLPSMVLPVFHEIRALFFRNDVPPPSLNRALVVDAYEFPRPSRPFFLYFITVHQDGGDSVSLFCIIAFGRCLARHCSYCTNRSEYVANTLWV